MKFRKYTKRIISLGVVVAATFSTLGIGAYADTTLADQMSAKGRMTADTDSDGEYDFYFDAADIDSLATGIDTLNSNLTVLSSNYTELLNTTESGKNSIVDAINNAGISSTTLDSSSTYADIASAIENLNAATWPTDAIDLTDGWDVALSSGYYTTSSTLATLIAGLDDSALSSNTYTDSDGNTSSYTWATADNLSAGTVAFGENGLIIGNGADNNSYYELGINHGEVTFSNVTLYYVHEKVGDGDHTDYMTTTFTIDADNFATLSFDSITKTTSGVMSSLYLQVIGDGSVIATYTSNASATTLDISSYSSVSLRAYGQQNSISNGNGTLTVVNLVLS